MTAFEALDAPTRVRSPRAEALLQGLLASEIPGDDAQIGSRAEQYGDTFQPRNLFHSWLVDQVALLNSQIDRSERIERRLRDRAALRALTCWDDDRDAEASALGARLADRGAKALPALRATAHGCRWLMGRWALLARAADVAGSWTSDQARLAFDLLGTPAEFRDGLPGVALDEEGRPVDGDDDPSAMARRQIAALRERRDRVSGLDRADRSLAEADFVNAPSPEIRRLRREVATLYGRLRWCLSQLRHELPGNKPRSPDGSEPLVAAIEPEPVPPRSKPTADTGTKPIDPCPMVPPHAPIDSEPDPIPAPGLPTDLEALLETVRKKVEARFEARRLGVRRKLERLRS